MFIAEVLADYVASLLVSVTGRSTEHVRAMVRSGEMNFAVFGYRAAGKTTLINRMMGAPLYESYTPTVGEDRLKPFEYFGITDKVSVSRMSDYGGDRAYWDLWDAAFVRDRPKGIVFMIDHEHAHDHQEAFRFLVDFISKRDTRWLFLDGRHVEARKQLKVVLFLANKKDEWSYGTTMRSFLGYFADDFRRIDSLGIPIIYHACSALDGTGVDDAMGDFFRRLVL